MGSATDTEEDRSDQQKFEETISKFKAIVIDRRIQFRAFFILFHSKQNKPLKLNLRATSARFVPRIRNLHCGNCLLH